MKTGHYHQNFPRALLPLPPLEPAPPPALEPLPPLDPGPLAGLVAVTFLVLVSLTDTLSSSSSTSTTSSSA